jgi:predicted membrane chloride channel (bestrophin family)
MDFRCALGVPLTGATLDAALKLRCDSSGAAYAIYWTNQNGKLFATGSYVADAKATGYVSASKGFTLAADGNGPIAVVKRTGQDNFVPDVRLSTLKRKELALQTGVRQIALVPFEDGVVEFGTVSTATQWTEVPKVPSMPKRTLRKAFEDLGALYCVYWGLDGTEFTVKADYENPRDAMRRKQLRGDGESFFKISREITLSNVGNGPVATALREKEEVVIVFDGESDYSENQCSSMKRGAKAREHGICTIHFVPVIDENAGTQGVLEYGVSTTGALTGSTLDSMLKMQAEAIGASYAVYWKKVYSSAQIVGKPFVSKEHRAELVATGKKLSYAEVSQSVKYDMLGDSPVAQALRTRKPIYVADVKATCGKASDRAAIAEEYLIDQAAFVPVLGGVIEYGTSVNRKKWPNGEADALKKLIPNEELEAALEKGATYMMYWERDDIAETYTQKASYELSNNLLSAKSDDSFLKRCEDSVLDANGLGPVAACGKSAATLVVPDTQTYPNFKRKELAKEWGVGKITCVPLETGVLEFGAVTKDKRTTTLGTEFQEATRPYRRTVFMHDQWVETRSTDRFFKSINSLFESGVLRARYKEIAIVMGFASFLAVWNSIAGGYYDLDNVKQAPLIEHLPVVSVPLSIFSLTAPTLGLLITFKTNQAYARWDNARKVWGDIINKCRSVVRQGNLFFDEDRYPGYGNFRDHRRRLAAETSAFTRCLRCFLRGKSDEPVLALELKLLGFEPDEVDGYMKAANKQVYALQKMSETISCYGADPRDRQNMDNTITTLCDDVGACERIFKTPIPLVYSRHTQRFVGLWLALLPLALWSVDQSWNHLVSIPSSGLIVFFLLGIEELGQQIEEPFGILPIEAFCDGSIGAALNEMVLAEDAKRVRVAKMAMAATPAIAEESPAPAPAPAPVIAKAPAPKPAPVVDVPEWSKPVASAVPEDKTGVKGVVKRVANVFSSKSV